MVSLLVVFHVFGFLSSVHAVMTNRTAQGAIAWGVSLNTFPYLAVPLYWVFGRNQFEGYHESWKEHQKEIAALVAQVRTALEPFNIPVVERLPHYQALKKLAHTSFLRGNDVELLVDGKATFDSKRSSASGSPPRTSSRMRPSWRHSVLQRCGGSTSG
ncbi:MAG TPA: hypothetical protein VMK42_04940 [Anaeromyxobacteraceae bacterium]|nr:hypothetical protein [Anaeromyxobacteraceae bacterium]